MCLFALVIAAGCLDGWQGAVELLFHPWSYGMSLKGVSLHKSQLKFGKDRVALPSIDFLYLLNPSVGSQGGWSLSQRSSGERWGTPWTGRQSITGPHWDKQNKQPCMLTLTPKDNSETPINLTCMFLEGGREPLNEEARVPQREPTHKLHTERSQVGIEPGTLSLWGDGANHHTTVQPLSLPTFSNITFFYRMSLVT